MKNPKNHRVMPNNNDNFKNNECPLGAVWFLQ